MLDSRPVHNLRIHLYGTQGSGSTFPSLIERQAFQHWTDSKLLDVVFADLARHSDGKSGRLRLTIEQIIGGPLNHGTLQAYRKRFNIADPDVFGGWTTCVHVETGDGDDIVLDCGSGFRNCARDLQMKWGDRPRRRLHLFGSHSHLDHTEGFEQAAICFDPRNEIRVYGNRQFLRALDSNLGIFTHYVSEELRGIQSPISFAVMPAKFSATEIQTGGADVSMPDSLSQTVHDSSQPIRVGSTTITPFEVYHPAPCLAYRIERGGKAFVFCTDHELRHGEDESHPAQQASVAAEARLREHAAGADLLYRDGQYLRVEYDGCLGIGGTSPVSRRDWGHSCIEDVVSMAEECGVHRTLIGHHDPNRDWSERRWLDQKVTQASAAGPAQVELAKAETAYDL